MMNFLNPFFKCALPTVIFFGFVLSAQVAYANTLILTIDGSDSAAVVNGQEVLLEWYINGDFTACTLSDGAGVVLQNIDTAPLATTTISGELEYTPLDNASTEFRLSCDGISDSVFTALKPSVRLSIDGGEVQTLNLSGKLEPTVRWNSDFATRCDLMQYEFSSEPGVIYTTRDNQHYSLPSDETFGWVRFRGWPNPDVRQTMTFYMTCHNDSNGTQATESITLTVLNPAPPDDVIVNVYPRDGVTTLTPDPFWGYAEWRIYTESYNRTWCDYSATDLQGNPITVLGYGHWGGHSHRTSYARFATSTILIFECHRPAITIGTTTYPMQQATDTLIMILDADPTAVDRTTLPPVTVDIITNPPGATSTEKSLVTGFGEMLFTVSPRNADYCKARAYDSVGNSISPDDLPSWPTRSYQKFAGNSDSLRGTAMIATSTEFEVYCVREFDVNEYPPGTVENTNGYASTSVFIELLAPAGPIPAPEIRVSINPVELDGHYMVDNAVSNTSFTKATQDFPFMRTPANPGPHTITFPFTSPDGSGVYDVGIQVCDDIYGESTFTVSTADDGVIGTYTTDYPFTDDWRRDCIQSRGTVFKTALGFDVPLDEGELITVKCVRSGSRDECQLANLVFGLNRSSVSVDFDTPTSSIATVEVMWQSLNTSYCEEQRAVISDGSWYYFESSNRLFSRTFESVATTTTFEVTCGQDGTGVTEKNQAEVRLPFATENVAKAGVTSGDCKLTVDGDFQTAPPGTIPNTSVPISDPSYGLCIPAADLGMLSPSASQLSVNNVTGTYDIRALLALTNHGPGALPDTSEVAYYASTELSSAAPYYGAYVARYGDASDETRPAPLYGDGIAEPVDPTDYSNPREVTINDVVFNDIPFGMHEMCSQVNIASDYSDPSDALTEPDLNPVDGFQDLENNGPVCTTYSLAVPEPPMNLTANPTIVRGGQGVELQWDINITYQMDCSINGPAGANDVADFNTLTVGPGYVDSAIIGPLSATSEFTFTCTEDLTNTTFTRSVTVEVIPTFQET